MERREKGVTKMKYVLPVHVTFIWKVFLLVQLYLRVRVHEGAARQLTLAPLIVDNKDVLCLMVTNYCSVFPK